MVHILAEILNKNSESVIWKRLHRKEECMDNYREISIAVYHPVHLIPHAVRTTDDKRCLPITRSEIHSHHVIIHFRELLIGARICSHVVYGVNPERPLQVQPQFLLTVGLVSRTGTPWIIPACSHSLILIHDSRSNHGFYTRTLVQNCLYVRPLSTEHELI